MADLTRSRWTTGIEDADRLARAGAEWIGGLARATLAVLRVVTIVAGLLGLLAVALGVAAVGEDHRTSFAVAAVVLFGIPFAIAWFVQRRIGTIVRSVPNVASDLRRVVTDPVARQEIVAALLETDADVAASRSGPIRVRHRLRSVWRLRKQVIGSRTQALDLWASLLGLSRVPFALLVVGVGCILLVLWCLVAAIAIVV